MREGKRIVVYTAVIGDRDPLRPPDFVAENVDYVCFTDDLTQPSVGWELRPVEWWGRDPIRTARRYKLLCHRYFEEFDYSLWVDANILPACDPWTLVEQFATNADLVLHQHPHRRCLYQEVATCIEMHKELTSTLKRQAQRYEAAGMPRDSGLFETGVLLRKHSAAVSEFNERWWAELTEHSNRDQISFPFALRSAPLRVATFPFPLRDNGYLRYFHHEVRPHSRYRLYLALRRYAGRMFRKLSSSLRGHSVRS